MNRLIMSVLGTLFLCLGFASDYDLAKPRISVSIKASGTPANFRKAVLDGKTLYGASLTDGALNPSDPVAAADLFSKYFNHARFHHAELQDVAKMVQLLDALYARGVRVSVGLADKLHEVVGADSWTFKRDLILGKYDKAYQLNIERMMPILKHPAVFLVVLSNECAHRVSIEEAKAFWCKWSPVLRKINPNLLLSDMADAAANWDVPTAARELVSLYDVAVVHTYADDGQATGRADWILEGWHFGTAEWLIRLSGKRGFIQEFGSYASNPHQGKNTAFMLAEGIRRGISMCHFAFATNEDGWKGTSSDKFAMDAYRRNLALLGTYLYRYGKKDGQASWGHDTGKESPFYRYESPGVLVTDTYAQVNGFIWTWELAKPWVWLVKRV